MKKTFALISFVLVLSFLFTGCEQKQQAETEVTVQTANGLLSNFDSVDINGNAVDETVFKDKKLTMINIWATYCGPCINEMPHLGELNKELADKGFQIIGIPVDVSTDVSLAKEIISETGADYLHILPSESLYNAKLSQVYSVPETIFVDENGCLVGESVIGARSKEDWIAIINERMEMVL
ncbi:MAG: TlpA family protein disulfide reductase [Ruminococcaceae bacterium]|nr:TlpA family protein disulfide reductase [Oscillospiraceae bacterium]